MAVVRRLSAEAVVSLLPGATSLLYDLRMRGAHVTWVFFMLASATFDLAPAMDNFGAQVQNALTTALPIGGALLGLYVGWGVLRRLVNVDRNDLGDWDDEDEDEDLYERWADARDELRDALSDDLEFEPDDLAEDATEDEVWFPLALVEEVEDAYDEWDTIQYEELDEDGGEGASE